MLLETWLRDLTSDVLHHLYAHHYMAHHLSATMSCIPAARNHRGILVFIQDRWYATSAQQQRCNFGEYIKLDIHGTF